MSIILISLRRDRLGRHAVLASAALALIVSLALTAWALGSGSRRPAAQPRPASPAASEPAAAGQSRPEEVFRQTLRVFVHPDGVRPALIHAAPGPISLRAENETGADVALVVERVSPGRAQPPAARVTTRQHEKRAHQDYTLGAGEYVFYEESRPQLRGRLIVWDGR